jgi:hypothetical protein
VSFAERAAALSRRAVSHFGGDATATLRRRQALTLGSTGGNTLALAMVGTTTAGAASLRLSGSGLSGSVFAGGELSLLGHVGPYTITADATAAAGELVVSIAPVLEAEVPPATVATLAASVEFADIPVLVGATMEHENADGVMVAAQRLTFPAVDGFAGPRVGDLVQLGSRTDTVLEVTPVDSGGGPSRWIVMVGVARGN